MTIDLTDPVAVLCELVAIPSVNPRGRAEPAEAAAAARLADFGRQLGAEVELTEVRDGRPNVILTVPGSTPGWVLLESHLDTVELPAGVEVPSATVADGRVVGRGACDAKGPLAVMLASLARLVRSGVPHPTVRLAGVVDEEHHFRGVLHLLDRLDAHLADCRGAVVGEPTQLEVVTAHKGVMRCRVEADGPGGHSSLGHTAVNPIVSVARAISELHAHAADLVGGSTTPLVGGGTLAVTMVSGGLGENSIPPACSAVLDRRLAPGEDAEQSWHAIRDLLADRVPQVRVAPAHTVDPSLCTDPDNPFVRALLATVGEHGGRADSVGANWGSDASKIAARGVPTVVWGPGSIAQAHTDGEYVEIDQLRRGVAMLTAFLQAR